MKQPAPDNQLTLFTGMVEKAVERVFERKITEPKRAADPRRKLNQYPERMSLRQVSMYWTCSIQHVLNLYDSGVLEGVDISTPGSSQRCIRIFRDSVAAHENKKEELIALANAKQGKKI
jgi:hypothetical protein